MKDKRLYATVHIRKRPWYVWLVWFIWLVWLAFWLEVSVGSAKETESRAFLISLIIFLVSLVAGVAVWIWRNSRAKKRIPRY